MHASQNKPEDTRARIMETAEPFSAVGVRQTTVADIAAELRMSPASVIGFPSKSAIVEAIWQCLSKLRKAWAVARSAPAAQRMEG